MNENNFVMEIIARLNKQLSKSAINSDLKSLNNSMYVRVVAKLSKTLTRKELNRQLKELNNLEAKIKANVKVDDKAKDQLKNNIKSLQKSLSDIEIGLKVSDSSKINSEIDLIRNTVEKRVGKNPVSINFDLKKEKLISDIEYLGKRFSKLFSNNSASKKYQSILSNAYSVMDDQQLSTARAELQAFTAELKNNGLAVQSTSDKWKKLINRSRELFSAATVLRTIFSQVKQAIDTTINLDKVYTDLVKVNDEVTRNDYSTYLSKINKAAKELAATQKGLIEGATEFSKSGYDLNTSNQLTEKSTILSNVGEMSASDSAKAIISGVQAYDVIDGYTDVVDKAQALIDKYNEIGNTASITTAELAQGVQTVGSVFKDANTSVDEFIALLSAGNRQFQDADSLSLGLRTSALRIRGCTAELEAMGEETDTVVTSTAKLEEKIKGLTNINGSGGVEILEADKETFRSIYDIYVDIGKVYKEMSDVDQSALLELIAGKHRASAVSATLNNMSEAEEILQNSLNAAGSAQKEYDKYLESTEAHIAKFKASLVETYSTFMNGNMISHTADMGTAIMELVNSTDLLKHSILAVLTLNVGKGITNIGAGIASTVKQMNVLGDALQQVKNLPIDSTRVDVLEQIGNSTKSLTEKNLKLLLSQKQLEDSDRKTILGMHNLNSEEVKLKLEKLGLLSVTQSQSAANVAEAATTGTLKNAMVSLKASVSGLWDSAKAMFMNNPIGIGLMLATTAISVFTTYISKQNEKLEETRQKNIEASDAASEHAKNLKELYNEYMRLVSIQERTNSEEESFKTAVENITAALGNKAKALEELTAGTNEYTEALAKATKEELQSQAVTATIGRKSAEEALQKEIWSDWSGSQVSIDSNSKGKSLSNEAQKAVGIVSDSLKEFETVNRTWKNISWDISSDDPEKALGFYNALIQAREDLVLAAEDDETLLNTEIYSDLNNSINSMSESLETYIEKRYEEEKLQYMAQKGIPQTIEEYKNMESSMLDVAGASEDLQEKFKDLLMEDFTSLAVDVENLTDTTDELNDSLSNNVLSIADAKKLVNGIKDGETESLGLIDELTLLQEVLSNTGNIQQETYEKLLSCSSKYSTAVRTENGRITLNTTKLKQVAKSRQLDTKETIRQTLALKKQEWIQWKNKIQNYNGTLLDSIEIKYGDIDVLQKEITQYELLVNSLDNASSAFERFKAAQQTNDQDMYDTAKDAFDVLKEYSSKKDSENYGKYNRDEFQEAAMLLMDEDTYRKALDAKDLVEYQKVVDGFVKSISPLFDENNAKSASRLFDEVDKILESGDVPKADTDWAERLGISKEAFNALKQLANQYDYENKEVFESFQMDKLDDYQEKLSNVAQEQETLNAITDKSSNAYQKQAQNLEQAQGKLDTFVDETVSSMTKAYDKYVIPGNASGQPETKTGFHITNGSGTKTVFRVRPVAVHYCRIVSIRVPVSKDRRQ